MQINDTTIHLANTGIVKEEYVKNAIHFFCAAVKWEYENQNLEHLRDGVYAVLRSLCSVSECYAKSTGIKAIPYTYDIWDPFFNQKNTIPGYIYFWLEYKYSGRLGKHISQYTARDHELYKLLQKCYSAACRFRKNEKHNIRKMQKEQRRALCRLTSQDIYTETLQAHNKSFTELFSAEEYRNAFNIFISLYEKQFENSDPFDDRAFAFLLGVRQGRLDSQRIK